MIWVMRFYNSFNQTAAVPVTAEVLATQPGLTGELKACIQTHLPISVRSIPLPPNFIGEK